MQQGNDQTPMMWVPYAQPYFVPMAAPAFWMQTQSAAKLCDFFSKAAEKRVVVVLKNVARRLCRAVFLETALDQAGFGRFLEEVECDSQKGQVILAITGEAVAQRVIQYFQGKQWGGSSILAKYGSNSLLPTKDEKNQQKSTEAKPDTKQKSVTPDMKEVVVLANEGSDVKHGASTPNPSSDATTPSLVTPRATGSGGEESQSDMATESSPTSAHKRSPPPRSVGGMAKPRWVDLVDGEDAD